VNARFDWGVFDDDARYLDEITCTWRVTRADPGAKPGTTLRMINLNDDWGRENGEPFQHLRGELSRLVSPLKGPSDFEIELRVPPAFGAYAGRVGPPAFLSKPRYWLVGNVNADGTIDAVYQSADKSPEAVLESGQPPKVLFPATKGKGKAAKDPRPPRCGPFGFEFRVWDRQREDLDPVAAEFNISYKDIRRDLDQAGGISIYRDGFRILLPGNDDWLRLDHRRVQNPTLRLSNNQIVGAIILRKDSNAGIVDQTNRQGIVDSPELEDLKIAVKEVLSKLETKRSLESKPPQPTAQKGGVLRNFEITALRAYITTRYPEDKDLQSVLADVDNSIAEGIGEVKTVLARYRRLATLGQLVDQILHEGRTPITAISNQVNFARTDFQSGATEAAKKLPGRLDVIAKQAEQLSALFRRIAPFSGRKRGRPQKTTIEAIIADAFQLVAVELTQHDVVVDLPHTSIAVTVDEAEMQSIFFNLIENALYWLKRVPAEKRKILVQTERTPTELQIVFSDSGPGVDPSIKESIFEPYFSTKPDGIGLGLALAGELALEYDGALELLAEGPLDGATFRVVLRTRIGEQEAA
jgi:hypothetical protein